MRLLAGMACVAMLLGASGCVTTGGLTSSFCAPGAGLGPIRLTAAEIKALSSTPKKAILKLNDYGASNCGWRP